MEEKVSGSELTILERIKYRAIAWWTIIFLAGCGLLHSFTGWCPLH